MSDGRPEDRAMSALSPVELDVWRGFFVALLTRHSLDAAAQLADVALLAWRARGGGGRR